MQTAIITTTWKPTLPQQDIAGYRTILKDIDEYLIKEIEKNNTGGNIGIMSGTMGELLYCFHSATHTDNETLYDASLAQLEKLIDNISYRSVPTFCSGTAGVIWALQYLEANGMVEGAAAAIDTDTIIQLSNAGIEQTKRAIYDYMHAGLSMALPLLAYYKKTGLFKEYLEALVDALYTSKLGNGNKYYWEYSIAEPDKPKSVSIGLSHGLPSIIAILSKISAEGIAVDQCNDLITGTLNYILHYKNTAGPNGLYPTSVELHPEKPLGGGRLGWCYGDMDIAVALHFANKVMPDQRNVQLINEIMDFCLTKDTAAKAVINESSLCHGAAGVAHIYNRFYNAYGDEKYKAATNIWMDITRQKMKKEDGKWWLLNTSDYKSQWDTSTNTITGISGVGLIFLSAIAPVTPDWDEMYLLNL